MSREETYKINFELNKDKILKDIKEIRDEVKSVTKEIDTDIKYIRLKRKDILIVKVNMFLKIMIKIR